MTEQQRQTDNMLLEMIQRHFPSLPLDDRYTDWQKWLGFARAAYEAGATAEREACAKAAEGFTDGRDDRKWVPGSLYDTLRRETAAFIRKRSNAELCGRAVRPVRTSAGLGAGG